MTDPASLVADLQAYVQSLTDDEFDALLADTRDDHHQTRPTSETPHDDHR